MKPTEVRLVASILESEADDTGALAEAIIAALDAKRHADDHPHIIITSSMGVVQAVGPYPTRGKAEAGLRQLAAAGPAPTFAGVRPLRTMESVTKHDRLM